MRVSFYKLKDCIFALTDEKAAFNTWRTYSHKSAQTDRFIDKDRARLLEGGEHIASFDAAHSGDGLLYDDLRELVCDFYAAIFMFGARPIVIHSEHISMQLSGRVVCLPASNVELPGQFLLVRKTSGAYF